MSYPRRVMIIRHGEETGKQSDIHLSDQGKRRAAALGQIFGPAGRLPGVEFLIAADRSAHSNRSVETLEPLAKSLGLTLRHEFEDDEYKALASRIRSGKKYKDSIVLIAWHHGTIPKLARALGLPKSAEDSAWFSEWPDEAYDHVWVMDFQDIGLVSIHDELQRLAL